MSKNYASVEHLKHALSFLEKELPNGSFKIQPAKGVKNIPHIRAQRISPAELKAAFKELGMLEVPDPIQNLLSGKFPVYPFNINGISYPIVIGAVRGSEDETSIGINRKELSPTGLGLGGKKFNKSELIKTTKQAITLKIRDENLKQALIGLVDIAATGGNKKLSNNLAEHIAPIVGVIAQDLGEILAPLIVMDNNDIAEFPAGNFPLIDVKLPGRNLSVKALTGSGTSFASIKDLMDKYETSMVKQDDKSKKFNVLKQFHPSAGGKNVDKIIRATRAASIPEYITICEILGTEITSFNQLENVIDKLFRTKEYGTFLNTIYPAMIAGNWGKPVGLPNDGKYYMGIKNEPPTKEKAAGKRSYDADKGKAGANIITYALGVGLLNYIKRGSDAKIYKDIITDIVKQSDAVLGHITINPDGSMELKTKPFSDLKFEFQYHAPSHIPGNNLPGFIYVPD
jgi:hypothetical protein